MSRLAAGKVPSLQDQAAKVVVQHHAEEDFKHWGLPPSLRKSFIMKNIKKHHIEDLKKEPSVGALLKRQYDGKIFKITNKYMVKIQNIEREFPRFDLKDIDSLQEIKKVVWNDGFKWYLPNIDMKYVNLHRIWLRDMDFEGANFEGADLSGASIRECNFENANFEGADFGIVFGTDIRECNFENANFKGADLRMARLTKCNFKNANFKWVDLRGKTFTTRNSPLYTKLVDTVVNDCNFEGAAVTGTLYNKDTKFIIGYDDYLTDTVFKIMKLDKNVMVYASTNRERNLDATLGNKKNLFYNTKF